jgi:hypothetical protein
MWGYDTQDVVSTHDKAQWIRWVIFSLGHQWGARWLKHTNTKHGTVNFTTSPCYTTENLNVARWCKMLWGMLDAGITSERRGGVLPHLQLYRVIQKSLYTCKNKYISHGEIPVKRVHRSLKENSGQGQPRETSHLRHLGLVCAQGLSNHFPLAALVLTGTQGSVIILYEQGHYKTCRIPFYILLEVTLSFCSASRNCNNWGTYAQHPRSIAVFTALSVINLVTHQNKPFVCWGFQPTQSLNKDFTFLTQSLCKDRLAISVLSGATWGPALWNNEYNVVYFLLKFPRFMSPEVTFHRCNIPEDSHLGEL